MLSYGVYLRPTTLRAALEYWISSPPGSRLVAGATDLLPWAREGRAGDVHISSAIDLSRVSELSGFTVKGGRVRLGANVVIQDFLEDETLKEHLPCMPYCAVWFADDQIRRQATLSGNIVNASPAADGTPPIIALNGVVEIARLEKGEINRRSVPIEEFATGPGTTVLQEGEIVTAIECDSCPGYGGSFEKVGQRRSLVISVVCLACMVKPGADGKRFDDVRMSLGGIGPVPVRLPDVEDFLRGREISTDSIDQAALMPVDRVQSRSRQAYRRDVIQGFVRRGLENALHDCGIELSNIGPETSEMENV